MTLHDALKRAGLSYRILGRALGVASTSVCRLVKYGEYPVRVGADAFKRRMTEVLEQHGVPVRELEWPQEGVRPGYTGIHRRMMTGGEVVLHTGEEDTEAINLMQLDRSVLQLFGLRTNPFLNDVEADDDVFPCKGHDQVTTAIKDAIEQRGFVAVCAPSGAGKTTIWDGIEATYAHRDDTAICRPMLKARERLTPEHLVRALLYGLLGDDAHIWQDAEARGRQLSRALGALRTGATDRKAVLYIDDAHFCSASVLRQLKTFYEEKVGRFRLLAIVLIGLPELKAKLAAFPEVGNRLRLVEVPQVPVQDYLQFKLRRIGSSVEKLFEPSGLEALLDRFRVPRRTPAGYPLIINTACIHAMVKLAQNGAQVGERITREIIDQLPGGTARRAA